MGEQERDEASPFTSTGFIVSAAFMALILAGGAWLGVSHLLDDSAPQAAPAPVTSSQAAAGEDSVCGLDAGSQDVPRGPLTAETVTVGDSLQVPQETGLGPGVTDGVSRCFAHSPAGAVMAAANFTRWFSSNQQLPEVLETLLVPGADRDRLIAAVQAGWDGTTTAPVAIQGYKVEVRSADEVKVDVAVSPETSIATLASYPLVMVWVDGDWKVRPPSNDEWGWSRIDGLTPSGYETWSVYTHTSQDVVDE